MRISTLMLHRQGVDQMLHQQALLAQTQNQIATGSRLQTAASAPADWATAASLDQSLAQLANYKANAGTAADRLGFAENALADSSSVLHRARELAVQLNSGALDATQRQIIGAQLQGLQQELLGIANTTDADGRYLFAGSLSGGAPFSLAGGSGVYSGDDAVRQLDISAHSSVASSDSGADVFQRIASGNGVYTLSAAPANTGSAIPTAARITDISQWDSGSYTLTFNGGNYEVRDSASAPVASGAYQAGNGIAFRGIELSFSGTPVDGDQFNVVPSANQDVFTTLQKFINLAQSAEAAPGERARNQTTYFGALQELDTAQAHMANLRGGIGTRLNAIEQVQTSIEANTVLAQDHVSALRDLDYAEATSRLSLQQTLLQAAQISYQRVQGLSLFDYLR